MQMSKQTVWLVTMLTLMVVLSAYYIVTGPVQPANEVTKQSKSGNIDVSIKSVDPGSDQPASATTTSKESIKGTSDYFVGYQLQRSALRQKMTEEWMKVLTNPDASKSELQEAQAKMDQLIKVDKKESVVEELIRKEGFPDAVVVTNDSHIDVVVQSKDLTREQAVKLISLVKDQMDVMPLNVSVAYRP
jgi:stage III sporulation protein AH